jgi:hypothetical protein
VIVRSFRARSSWPALVVGVGGVEQSGDLLSERFTPRSIEDRRDHASVE